MIKLFLLYNWTLILILTAFSIMLKTTVFLDRRTVKRMYYLIGMVFILSVSVFAEFYLDSQDILKEV